MPNSICVVIFINYIFMYYYISFLVIFGSFHVFGPFYGYFMPKWLQIGLKFDRIFLNILLRIFHTLSGFEIYEIG